MKATKKLIPAIAMLIVSAVVMSTASFAWFTMSREVTAQGMDVKVTAPDNLLIKTTGAADTEYEGIDTQTIPGVVLVPASTLTAKAGEIFQLKDGSAANYADGSLISDKSELVPATLAVGSADALGVGKTAAEGGYYDFKYDIKTQGDDAKVYIASVTATEDNGVATPVRIAVLDKDGNPLTSAGYIFNPNSGTLNSGKVIEKLKGDSDTATAGINGMLATTDIAYGENSQTIAKDAADATNSFDVTTTAKTIIVRVWYEGQDTTCVSSTAAGSQFDISLVLKAAQ